MQPVLQNQRPVLHRLHHCQRGVQALGAGVGGRRQRKGEVGLIDIACRDVATHNPEGVVICRLVPKWGKATYLGAARAPSALSGAFSLPGQRGPMWIGIDAKAQQWRVALHWQTRLIDHPPCTRLADLYNP